MFANEVALHIVNFASMKFTRSEMGTKKRLIIVTRNETNFLAVDLVGHFQA